MDISNLEALYVDSCRRYHNEPSSAVRSWFSKAKIQNPVLETCSITVLLDQLKDGDIPPVIDVFRAINSCSAVDAVDVLHESLDKLSEESIMSLLQTINRKLRVLYLRFSRMKKLDMVGSFRQLVTLNLDFFSSMTCLNEECFSCMPSLVRLSICGTRVANLWTTTFVLSKLPSLLELRFQSCSCCNSTGHCPESFNRKVGFEERGSGLTKQSWMNYEDEFVLSVHTSSPICFERHYREFVVFSLPRLDVLDNLLITKTERKAASVIFSRFYEYLPYKRRGSKSISSILQKRELGSNGVCHENYGKGQYFFSRSLAAAKLGSAARPYMHSLTNFSGVGKKRLRTRQFEYHPSDSGLMALGTLDGEVVVINHESTKIRNYVPSTGSSGSVLGLCWLKNFPTKLLAGSDGGSLKLFDVNHFRPKVADIVNCSDGVVTFDDFKQLTSVHVNSTDTQFIASGCSKGVALYDISTRTRLQFFNDIHRAPINVAKFAHHCPFLFATTSFDHDVKLWDLRQKPEQPCFTASSSRGNVMICFSPDDLYLLVSSVDNEVKQLLAVDGRLHMKFDVPSTGSDYNYTRSYYISGRDYIISGSSEENVVRICCAQTGRRLRDIYMEDYQTGNPLFVQTLRSDPYRAFHMSILTSSNCGKSKSDILKVNLLASSNLRD